MSPKKKKIFFRVLLVIAVILLLFFLIVCFLIKKYLGAGEQYLSILLKVMGITYICEFSSGICKDAGYGTVASQIEILGKLSVMFAGIPVLFAVIEQLQSFVS